MEGCHNCAKENRRCPWDGSYHHRDEKGDIIKLCNGYEGLSGSVLISIRPNWTPLIREMKKKWEIRKTKPKLKPPFKCFIYETLGKKKWDVLEIPEDQGGGVFDIRIHEGCGKVIGEFICDRIVEVGYSPYNHGEYVCEVENIHEESCVGFEAMFDYIADGYGYAWHIADLIIYQKARDLKEFASPEWFRDCEKQCPDLERMRCPVRDSRKADKMCGWCRKGGKPLARAPQSWGYCTEVRQELTSRRIL